MPRLPGPLVNQDEMNSLVLKHWHLVRDMGKYESVGRSMSPRIDGLAYMYDFLKAFITMVPECFMNYGQWRIAVANAEAVKKKDDVELNVSTFNVKIWSGQRAERFMTALNHLRRIKKAPDTLEVFAKKASKDAIKKVEDLTSPTCVFALICYCLICVFEANPQGLAFKNGQQSGW